MTATFRKNQPGFSFSSDTGITLSAPSDWPASRTSEWEFVSRFAQSNAGTNSVVICVLWYRTSAAKYKRTALFWVFTQRVMVIPYRRFGTTYRSHLEGSRIQEEACLSINTGSIRGGQFLTQLSSFIISFVSSTSYIMRFVCMLWRVICVCMYHVNRQHTPPCFHTPVEQYLKSSSNKTMSVSSSM